MSTGGQYPSCSCWQHYWYKPRCHWTSWQPHTLLAHIWLSTDQHFQLLFLCTVFQPLPHTCSDAWGCWDQGGELGLVELHPTGLSPSIQPVQIPPKGFPTLKLPPNLVSSANLLRVHSIFSPRSSIKLSNRTGPSTSPWETPLVINHRLDLTPFITTLWTWPSSQFFIHPSVPFQDTGCQFPWRLYDTDLSFQPGHFSFCPSEDL